MSGAPMLVHLHVPKTAGTTFRELLERQVLGRGLVLKNAFKGRGGFDPGWTERLLPLLEPGPDGSRPGAVSGHIPFSVSQLIRPPASYLTFLRDPLERVLSHYFYLRDGASFHRPWRLEPHQTLKHVVTERTLIYDNLQTRMLSGETEPDVPATPAMLEAAKRNLDAFAAVGLVERFDDSLVVLRLRLGWRALLYEPQRVNETRPPVGEIDPDDLELVGRHNELDRELYAHAAARLERELAELGTEFGLERAAFAAAQAAHVLGRPRPPAADPIVEARARLLEEEMRSNEALVLHWIAMLEADTQAGRAEELAAELERLTQRLAKAEGRAAKAQARLERREAQLERAEQRLETANREESG